MSPTRRDSGGRSPGCRDSSRSRSVARPIGATAVGSEVVEAVGLRRIRQTSPVNSEDWNSQRVGPSDLELLDASPESAGIDLVAVRGYRQGRVRAEMERHGIDAVILSDAVNIRYATGTRNMQIFSSRNAPSRYLLLTADRSILFEFTGCEHLADGFETVDEVRPAMTASFCAAGPAIASREIGWAKEMSALVCELVGAGATVGMERMNAGSAIALAATGITIVDAQQPVEMARSIKSTDEVKCITASLRATEIAVGKLRDAIRPGMTETELWSIMFQSVIEQNGDYCETRLLNSGHRSNPWFRETTHHVIRPNTMIALDTDVVGCHGYYSDFSRTFHAGPDAPSAEQRLLYRTALEQVEHNIGILHPGLTFREYARAGVGHSRRVPRSPVLPLGARQRHDR